MHKPKETYYYSREVPGIYPAGKWPAGKKPTHRCRAGDAEWTRLTEETAAEQAADRY